MSSHYPNAQRRTAAPTIAAELLPHWERLGCQLDGVAAVFSEVLPRWIHRWDAEQLESYLAGGKRLGQLGRGAEPVLCWLECWPDVLNQIAESQERESLETTLWALVQRFQRSPNSAAIAPLLQVLAPVARRLGSAVLVAQFLDWVGDFADDTSGSVHGRQVTQASPSLVDLLRQSPRLLQSLSLEAWHRWVAFGVRAHAQHPDQQRAYFRLESAESIATWQRERHGTLWVDVDRTLGMDLRAFWSIDTPRAPMLSRGDATDVALSAWHDGAFGLPDVLDDAHGVTGLMRYRLRVMHLAAHQAHSVALIADNWSPMQRMAVEGFEDARVDAMVVGRWPGLRQPLLALHPEPKAEDCDESTHSCVRHRLARWSRAALERACGQERTTGDPVLDEWVTRWWGACQEGADTQAMASLALGYVAATRSQSDAKADVVFVNTLVDWRDDNRHLWRFIEEGDEEDTQGESAAQEPQDLDHLPPKHYPEWDYLQAQMKEDWVSLYEHLHPAGSVALLDELVQPFASTQSQLKRVLDQLRPQSRERVRRLEQGSELDLDVALNAWVDWRSGHTPDDRVMQHHRPAERDIAVMLLIDASASLADAAATGSALSRLQVAQAGVRLLGDAMASLGDAFAIAAFHSNTRHEVRYWHIKGYSEAWDDTPKARLAALEPGYSTRMGAALRHAGRTLAQRPQSKKLLLVLTDGEPSDVDVHDPKALISDAHQAVAELETRGVFTWCLNVDSAGDADTRAIYGERFTMVDRVPLLPQRLAEVFVRLTKA
ncbi:MAG: hypothetical protein RL357_1647 [Pseudomonadota bacterium]